MKRRQFLMTAAAVLLAGGAAQASDFSDAVLRKLERAGYRILGVSRTLLGRTRIRASRLGGEREIVMNAATGEILRDVWVIAPEQSSAGTLGGVDPDDDEADDDDHGDDDDDGDDDDSSGHGGDGEGGGDGGGGEGGDD